MILGDVFLLIENLKDTLLKVPQIPTMSTELRLYGLEPCYATILRF